MKNTTSISAFIKQAVYENNEGTRFVRRCQYNSAERSFTSVLMILQQLADIVENKYDDNNGTAANANENSDTDVDVDVDAYVSTTTSIPLAFSFQHRSMDTNNTSGDDDSNTHTTISRTSSSSTTKSTAFSTHTSSQELKYFVFCDPIVIGESSFMCHSPGLLSKLLTIIMYNLALTLHLHALLLASSSATNTNNKNKQMKNKIKNLVVRSNENNVQTSIPNAS
eukprot:CAMPEP_0170868272 /NCGR_PEP_ID=MMETSP0734-20130129/23438_1 /TAXON_ID=186038 /ORGANISM="Fragilariopsis kerguelensis, Strain L26-C5" /LENGTH=223 /DNA_ID=CAMNT_0011245967 /DNA_START=63 /DNA_END=734 /DNA_ORIENTATION=-